MTPEEIDQTLAQLYTCINQARRLIETLQSVKPPNTQTTYVGEISRIVAEVSKETGISIDVMRSRNKCAPIFLARAEAMRRIYATKRYTLPQIGRYFRRDHTTVRNAIDRAELFDTKQIMP